MSWFRRSPAPPSPAAGGSRRRFFAGAGALLGGALLAGRSARAATLTIEPGTVVDAQGRPLGREARYGDPFIAEIIAVPYNFAPRGWAFCDGQLLPIASNTALFSLIGTTYGGDGRTTMGLPDLQGRIPMHPGRGPGLTPRSLGQKTGAETATLSILNLPNHAPSYTEVAPRAGDLNGGVTGGDLGRTVDVRSGGGLPHNNMSPFLALNYCIALTGIFPPRS